MNVIVVKDMQEMSRAGADVLIELLRGRPDAAVVFAMGNSPMGMYKEVEASIKRGETDVSQLLAFQLDGYLGLTVDDPRSLEGWLRRSVVEPWGIPEEHMIRLPEDGTDPEADCREYERRVKQAGGYDLAVLGLGPNGHLGFNEPPSQADSPTRVVPLTEASLRSNAGYWGGIDQVPRSSLTAGMDLLLGSRRILLLVNGAHKRDILRKTVFGPVTPDVPSSYLQRCPYVTIIADEAAWPGDEV